jgi:hypothetical protein
MTIPRSIAFTSEGTREAARGRSRRTCGLREPEVASIRGPHSRGYRPRAPRTRPSARRLAPRRSGRRARGARGLRSGAARAVPHAARPTPGPAAERNAAGRSAGNPCRRTYVLFGGYSTQAPLRVGFPRHPLEYDYSGVVIALSRMGCYHDGLRSLLLPPSLRVPRRVCQCRGVR